MVVFSFQDFNHVLSSVLSPDLCRQKKLSGNPGRYMAYICMDLSLSKEKEESPDSVERRTI